MKMRITVTLAIVFILIFGICFYFFKKNEDSIRNYSKFRLAANEREWISRELTKNEKQRLTSKLQKLNIRYKDTLGDIYIYNSEFFKSQRPLFIMLTKEIVDSALNRIN